MQKQIITSFLFLITHNLISVKASQSPLQTYDFPNSYSADWYTHNNDGLDKIRITLRSKDIDTTGWATDNSTGYWMGIGFGNTNLNGVDIITWKIPYTDSDNDTFTCEDRYSTNDTSIPQIDAE